MHSEEPIKLVTIDELEFHIGILEGRNVVSAGFEKDHTIDNLTVLESLSKKVEPSYLVVALRYLAVSKQPISAEYTETILGLINHEDAKVKGAVFKLINTGKVNVNDDQLSAVLSTELQTAISNSGANLEAVLEVIKTRNMRTLQFSLRELLIAFIEERKAKSDLLSATHVPAEYLPSLTMRISWLELMLAKIHSVVSSFRT